MGQTLTHGIYLPDEGERNCYSGLAANWQLLDGAVGTVAEHTTALAGKAPAVHTHTKADITDLFNSANTWTGDNTFNTAPSIKGHPSLVNDSMTLGTVPASTLYNGYWFKGSTSNLIGSTDLEWYSSGKSAIVTRLTRNAAGASREIAYSFTFPQTGNGTFKVYGDCIPSDTNTYDLGSSSYQWNNLYAKNYYYNGVAWGLDKANTWTGENTFQAQSIYQVNNDPKYVYKNSSLEIGVQPTGSHTATSYWLDKNNNELGFTRFVEYNNSTQTYEIRLSNKATNGALNPNGNTIATNIQYTLDPNGVSKLNLNINALRPVNDGLSDLGDSTHRWKTLNGINPGALSLPSNIGYDPIDTRNWDLTGDISNPNFYTPTVDGWLCIIAFAGTMTDAWFDIWVNSLWGQSVSQSQSGELFCMIPVRANLTVRIRIKASYIYDARLFIASGNV